jgi:hypothetical protein
LTSHMPRSWSSVSASASRTIASESSPTGIPRWPHSASRARLK